MRRNFTPCACASCFPAFRDARRIARRHINRRRRVRRNGHVQAEPPVLDLPRAGDAPVDGIVVRAHPVNRLLVRVAARRRRRGPDDDALVARPVRLDARQLREHPFADRAERVMREGIHLRVLRAAEAFVLGIAVPALPNGRRALLDLITPRRVFAALQEAHGQIVSGRWPTAPAARAACRESPCSSGVSLSWIFFASSAPAAARRLSGSKSM